MSVNKYKSHVLILPEDDANRQIANGFILGPNLNQRNIQIMNPSGGWSRVVEDFANSYAPGMRELAERMVVLLIDFDQDKGRLAKVQENIPLELKDRVFILGVFSEPEKLKRTLGKSFESIGINLAKDCSEDKYGLWGHELLKHNKTELERMIELVKPFLFGDTANG